MLKVPSGSGLSACQAVPFDRMQYGAPVRTSPGNGLTPNDPSTILADRHQIYKQWVGVLQANILHVCKPN